MLNVFRAATHPLKYIPKIINIVNVQRETLKSRRESLGKNIPITFLLQVTTVTNYK